MKSAEGMAITPADLKKFVDPASVMLKMVEWVPGVKDEGAPPPKEGMRTSGVRMDGDPLPMSITEVANVLSKDPLLVNEDVNHLLHVLRKGLQIGMHVADQYQKRSGLQDVIDQNKLGVLTDGQRTAFRSKGLTAGAIAAFSTANYVVWNLGSYKSESVEAAKVQFNGLPELSLQGTQGAYKCMLFYLGRYLSRVESGHEALKMTLLYCKKVIDEIKLYKLEYTDSFISVVYKLEGEEFSIRGFEASTGSAAVSVEFAPTKYEEIVGNREAIHQSQRIMQRIVLGYNPKDGKNPFQKLGGIARVRMGKGIPGTGKSKLIAANATEGKELCEKAKRPFLFSPMPDNIISTFQGGSAERAMDWFRSMQDPTRIIYMPMDDAENVVEDRTRQGVSAGVREVIGVFLRATEGAYAIDRGNVLLDVMTNLPEQIDMAILSRIQDRFDVNGARTDHDFIDQDYLWWREIEDTVKGFIDMKDPDDYKYLEDQVALRNISQLYKTDPEPEGKLLKQIFAEVNRQSNAREHRYYGMLFRRVQVDFPLFSSRDVRNIQRAVSGRLMDFDMPELWIEKPEAFADQPYDNRLAMVKDLMRENTKGLSFSQIRYQQTVSYLNVMTSITENAHNRKVEEYAEGLRIQTEAGVLFAERQKAAKAAAGEK